MTTRTILVLAAALGGAFAPRSAVAAQMRMPDDPIAQRLASHLDSLDRVGEFSGVVLLARNGAPILERPVGMADRERGIPNTMETAFNVGSLNKLFTRTAIMQLAERGVLHLDSTLTTYWPDYPNVDVARRVTIRQMLEHRSGIGGDIFAAPAGGDRHDLRHNDDFLPLVVGRALDFEPGAEQRYSNAGYVVLGALVQRLSGVDYYEYVRRNILEPAGMRETVHWPSDSLPAHVAIGYTKRGAATGGLVANTRFLPGRGSAAGGGYSTAGDLLALLNALRARAIAAGPPAGIGAAGGADGLNALIEGDMPGGYDLIVLANLDPPAAGQIGETVRGWLAVAE